MEIWKSIEGYEGMYEISDSGHIRSLPGGKTKPRGEIVLKQYVTKFGYATVVLCNGNHHKKHFFVHRLIAEAFIPKSPGKNQVNHISGIKLDNSIINLEWCTPGDNQRHAFRLGLKKAKRGEKSAKKLNWQQITEMRNKHARGEITYYRIAKNYKISPSTARSIILRELWQTQN